MQGHQKLSVLALAAATLIAQPAARLEFDAVSIRPHPGVVTVSSNMINGATYRGVAITLVDLVTDAYGMKYDQVTGGPRWASSERFDIEARAGGEGPLGWD